MLLIICILQTMEGAKTASGRVGGVGYGDFEEMKRGKEQGIGNRFARIGDWTVIIWASRLQLFLLCARRAKFSATPDGEKAVKNDQFCE